MKRNRTLDTSLCIHCKKCTENCLFLTKYNLDFGDSKQINDLAYHCYLCGKCTEVCPVGIDGREVILRARQKAVRKNKGKIKGYHFLRLEKQNYIFKNYKRAKGKIILFPGCNFPAFYPETTKCLYTFLKSHFKIGIAYDCCGKPIAELGLEKEANEIIARQNRYYKENNIAEIVVLCPNCYYYLSPLLEVKVTSIYEKLHEIGFKGTIKEDIFNLFIPCPDKESLKWKKEILPFLDGEVKDISGIQCCGVGGCAHLTEPELSKTLLENLKKKSLENVYTYCGTCGGNISRSGAKEVHHLLPELLKTREVADIKHSLVNRIKTKYK
ncbi:MAG TPA: (Fe-S)-binding protein [Candidatus Dorea intestinavium]|nr:(Fe-S)-binding protein [Candidatus Dorea intestinavium]